MRKCLSIKAWKKRCERLYAKADAMTEEINSIDTSKNEKEFKRWSRLYSRQKRLYDEATLISMMLDTFKFELSSRGLPC